MYYKLRDDVAGAYIVADALTEGDDGFVEMDDSLFEAGYGGNIFLKSFLANPSDEYIIQKKRFDDLMEQISLEQYLANTDYVIAKLNELKLEDDAEYEIEKANYAEVLAKRKEARKRINEIKAELEAN
jgi:hypothetical protein